jgi:hypothetical protein
VGMQSNASVSSYRVGVTGHRMLKHPAQVVVQIRQALADIKAQHPMVMACSPLAIGADTLFAEAALDLNIPLEVVIPFAEYLDDFEIPDDRDRYERLLTSASSIVRLPGEKRSDSAYQAAGLWIIQTCQMLVAIWDGQPTTDIGGTADVIAQAERFARPIIRISAARMAEDSH